MATNIPHADKKLPLRAVLGWLNFFIPRMKRTEART